jgi:hypothetical protein
MPVAVVLCQKLLTTEGSFASPTAVPQVPWLYARAYSLRIVSSAFRQASRLSKRKVCLNRMGTENQKHPFHCFLLRKMSYASRASY